MSQIKWDGHESGYVLAPPIVAPDPDGTQWMTSASVCVVDRNRAKPVSDRALAWLLEQPDLPDEFRRAAAVHLDR
ncbi:MAG: hypothetical protein KDC46_03515 [Thermoleophilia bacterium]|nr:hypothetical protein [Thermoleophilia bacterium]